MLATAAAAFAMLFAGLVIVLELNKGTLTIESEADDVALRIRQGDDVVERLTVSREGKQVRIAAGKYVIEIDGPADAVGAKDGNVTIERGGADIVRVVQRDATGTKRDERRRGAADLLRTINPASGAPERPAEDKPRNSTDRTKDAPKQIVDGDLAKLQGKWDGQTRSANEKVTVSLTIKGTAFTEVRRTESEGELKTQGRIELDESAKPKQLTMKASLLSSSAGTVAGSIPTEFNAIHVVRAIYKLDDDRFTMRGSVMERPTGFDENDTSQITFKRHEHRDRSLTQRRLPGSQWSWDSTQSGPRLGAEELLIGTWNGLAGHYTESYTFRADGTFRHESTAGRHTTSDGTWEFDGRTFSLILNATRSDDQPVRQTQIVKVVGLGADRLAFDNPSGPIAFTRSQPQDLHCELRPAKQRWAAGQAPTLTCRIENSGKIVHATRLQQGFHHVEVDGSPYVWSGEGTSEFKPIAAGGFAEIPFTLAESDWVPLWTAEYRRNKRLQLNPGKHKVRVCIFAGSGDKDSLTDPGAGPLIQVWSNAVEIEIVAAENERSDASSGEKRAKSREAIDDVIAIERFAGRGHESQSYRFTVGADGAWKFEPSRGDGKNGKLQVDAVSQWVADLVSDGFFELGSQKMESNHPFMSIALSNDGEARTITLSPEKAIPAGIERKIGELITRKEGSRSDGAGGIQ
jgi:uncharacterized protein (TIGR03067 family)